MLLKPLDTHEEDIALLNSFLKNDNIPSPIKNKIKEELIKINSGLKAQKEAAYKINFDYEQSKNHFVIHDLRLQVGKRVAQIDHLIFNRFLEVAVCETKNFSEGFSINEQLEFTAFYNHKPVGIASPIEQNKHHISVLSDIFDTGVIELPTRLGFKMNLSFLNFIITSNNARITRPKRELPDKTYIIKNDQFQRIWSDEDETRLKLSSISKMVYADTVESIAKKVLALHKPIEFNWVDKFGISQYLNNPNIPVYKSSNSIESMEVKSDKKSNTYVCATCSSPLDNGVVFWCRKNKLKFNNQFLCREHQPAK